MIRSASARIERNTCTIPSVPARAEAGEAHQRYALTEPYRPLPPAPASAY